MEQGFRQRRFLLVTPPGRAQGRGTIRPIRISIMEGFIAEVSEAINHSIHPEQYLPVEHADGERRWARVRSRVDRGSGTVALQLETL